MAETAKRPDDPPSYPKDGTYADLLTWHLKVWWTRPSGSTTRRGSEPWTTAELLRKVFASTRDDIENQNNLFKNWTGDKKKERSGSDNATKISEAIFGDKPHFLIWADDLEKARERTQGAGANKLTITVEACLATLTANGYIRSENEHIGADAREGVAVIANRLTKHFYGRASDLTAINTFVDERMTGSDSALLIITAPAGFGKSALAANWCNNATNVAGRHVVSHLCSIASGEATTSLKNIFANLRRQLAEFYGDATDKFRDDDAVVNLLATAPPNGKQLVLWLDGIDEAREPVPCFLPLQLGERVCVILSARADDESTPAYIDEWQYSPRAQSHKPTRRRLDKLPLGDVDDMATGMFFAENLTAPDGLALRIFNASEQGYALFARYMVEDAIEATRNEEEIELGDEPASLRNFAVHQLKRLQAFPAWPEFLPLFAFLAIARESVSVIELPALLGKAFLPEAIPHAIFRWFRLVEAPEQTTPPLFSFAHPKLAEVFSYALGYQAKKAACDLCNRLHELDYAWWPTYAWRQLPQHFLEAGQSDRAELHLMNFNFIERRSDVLGVDVAVRLMIVDWTKWANILQVDLDENDETDGPIGHLRFWDWHYYEICAASSLGFKDAWRQLFYDVEMGPLFESAHLSNPKRCALLQIRKENGKRAGWTSNRVLGSSIVQPSGEFVFWTEDNRVHVTNRQGQLLWSALEHTDRIYGVMQLRDRRGFVSWGADRIIRLWDFAGTKPRIFNGHQLPPRGVTEIGIRSGFISWGADCTLRLWGPDGQANAVMAGHEDDVDGVVVLENGREFISWSADSKLMRWDSEGERMAVFTGHAYRINGAIALSDKERVASWSNDGTIIIWNAHGKKLRHLPAHARPVNGVLELENGAGLLSWGDDGALRLWNDDGALTKDLLGHLGPVWDAGKLPNNAGFFSRSNHEVKIWDADGNNIYDIGVSDGNVDGVVIDHSDNRVVTWNSCKGVVYIWDLSGKLLNIWISPTGYVDDVKRLSEPDEYLVTFDCHIGIVHLSPA